MPTLKGRLLHAIRNALWPLSTVELAGLTGTRRGTVMEALLTLHRAGVVRRVQGAKRVHGTRWRVRPGRVPGRLVAARGDV